MYGRDKRNRLSAILIACADHSSHHYLTFSKMVIQMKSYHITFLKSSDDQVSTGKTYQAMTPICALAEFEIEYPNATFLYIASSDMFNYKY